ncbi:MAG: VTT domain-containing protein [Anaerovoracaceae bacterium]
MDSEKKEKIKKKLKLINAFFKLGILGLILIGLPLYIYFFQKDWITDMSSLKNVQTFFEQYKSTTLIIYIVAQVAQIVICIIPGQWLQFAAGYMYGFWLGYLYSIIGALIGSVITYYLAKVLGRDAIHLLFGEEKINNLIKRLNSKKGVVLVFLIFLIPGIPKDLCNYAAGVSDMKLKPFLIVSLLGRTPGMMGSLLIGRQIMSGGYTSAIIIGVIAIILFAIGVIYRKRVHNLLDIGYERLMRDKHDKDKI